MSAQTVFIADLNARVLFEELVPGCMDDNGNLDTAYLADQFSYYPQEVVIDWAPADLFGLQFFRMWEMDLWISSTDFSFTGLPPMLERVSVHGPVIGSQIPLPNGLQVLSFHEAEAIAQGMVWPDSLRALSVHSSSAVFLPSLPSGLKSLEISSIDGAVVLDALPSTLEELVITSVTEPFEWPVLPDGLRWLAVHSCAQTQLPDLPDSLRNLYLWSTPLMAIPDLPAYLEVLELVQLAIEQVPLLPESLTTLWVGSCEVHALPGFPAGLESLKLDGLFSLDSLPSLDASQFRSVVLAGLPMIEQLPRIFRGVQLLGLSELNSVDSIFIDFGDSAICELYITDMAALRYIESFPYAGMDESGPMISNAPHLTCLPRLGNGCTTLPWINTPVLLVGRTILPLCRSTLGHFHFVMSPILHVRGLNL